jgi:hypothetical protein
MPASVGTRPTKLILQESYITNMCKAHRAGLTQSSVMSTTDFIDRDGDVEMQEAGPSEPSTVTSGHKREDSGYAATKKAAPIDRFVTDEASWNKYVSDVGQMYYLRPEMWGRELDAEGFGNINVGSFVGDLANDVHPLFAHDRFILENFVTNTNSNLWRDLEPALRLASRMLLSPPVMAFLRKVTFEARSQTQSRDEYTSWRILVSLLTKLK